ncbi:hypothetical protein DFH08DRAFT_389350 [Mycena albidolilacea]|uniref:Uncharacterized protein n=1 Tax=Mycena albidolilacea TaxID=1033008 RepID=A0AAD7EG16_9AGAR|nr:hypothetical protein DFH08DRAFT_389350 [Mycena albidolilacea]
MPETPHMFLAGPLFVGVILNWALLGALTIQIYDYHTSFRNDRRAVQILASNLFRRGSSRIRRGGTLLKTGANRMGCLKRRGPAHIYPSSTALHRPVFRDSLRGESGCSNPSLLAV